MQAGLVLDLQQPAGAGREAFQQRLFKEREQRREPRGDRVIGHGRRREQHARNDDIDRAELIGKQRRDNELTAIIVVPARPALPAPDVAIDHAPRQQQPRHQDRQCQHVGDEGIRQLEHEHDRQQHHAHGVGRNFAPKNRLGHPRPAFQRAGRNDQQCAEQQKRCELLQPAGERRLAQRSRDRSGRNGRRERKRARRNSSHQGGKTLQSDLRPMIVAMPRHVKQQHQRPAHTDRHAGEPIEAEGRHQVAETAFGEEPAEDHQDDKLRGEPEHAGARADDQNVEIGPQPAIQENAGNTVRDCVRQPHLSACSAAARRYLLPRPFHTSVWRRASRLRLFTLTAAAAGQCARRS